MTIRPRKKAEEVFLKYTKSEGVFLSILVLAETTQTDER
jgi:hypothetical protein